MSKSKIHKIKQEVKQKALAKMRNNLINRNLLDHYARFLATHPDPGVFAELLVKNAH